MELGVEVKGSEPSVPLSIHSNGGVDHQTTRLLHSGEPEHERFSTHEDNLHDVAVL